jgi:PTS system ascorbate-specific IIA component
MSVPLLSADAVILGAEVASWQDAVRLAGTALTRAGIAKPEYGDEMVRMIEEHGPYVVIAPGLALAHARPGPEVLADGLGIVTLSTPVDFGHPYNDPVSVILALAVASGDAHIALVAELANIFNDSTAVTDLAAATTVDEVLRIMTAAES